MEDKLQSFRQPMVTATGIILGFVLNFANAWVKAETTFLPEIGWYIVGACVFLGIVCLIMVLYRALNMSYPRASAEQYYRITLLLFIWGLGFAFTGAFIDMISSFMAT